MGTSGSYSGSGGKAGRDLRQGLEEWLDTLPVDTPPTKPPNEADKNQPPFPPKVMASAVALLRPSHRGGTGEGGAGGGGGRTSTGRTGGGAQRTVRQSAVTAGRAAAAAYAFRTGDRTELERLGLDYDVLRGIDDPLELTKIIVETACGPRSEGTIEDHERRYVAAEIAAWILEQDERGTPPDPKEIVRKTIATIIFEIIETESGDLLRQGNRPAWTAELKEGELREAAEVFANQAELSVNGASAEEFSRAIEEGVETFRRILQGAD